MDSPALETKGGVYGRKGENSEFASPCQGKAETSEEKGPVRREEGAGAKAEQESHWSMGFTESSRGGNGGNSARGEMELQHARRVLGKAAGR